MSMSRNPFFSLIAREDNRLAFLGDAAHVVRVFVLEEDLIRVMLLPRGDLRFPRTWAIAPGQDDVPVEGRDRLDLGSGLARRRSGHLWSSVVALGGPATRSGLAGRRRRRVRTPSLGHSRLLIGQLSVWLRPW